VMVDEAGRVIEAEPLCGPPLIREAGVEAVRKWRFSPTLRNGRPVKVTGTVTINFELR
jgi:periplasmic protein TonB